MTETSPRPWWRDAVIYQLYIRSFADADGDGIGDIAGIRARLPYVRDLGVDGIWINPWYPSPMADGGYDVADYRDIDPLFGSLADADALIADAHALGLKVLLDIVPNHTSDRHAWFRAALAAGPGSRERGRYIFRDGRGPNGDEPPTDWPSVFGGPAWTRVTEADGRPGQWYLHLFAPEQPDLDWTEPEVGDEFESILRFWYERGADGFRIDVAHGLAKDPAFPDLGDRPPFGVDPDDDADHPHWDRDAVLEVYARWRAVADEYGERPFVGEVFVARHERLARFVGPGRLHTAFDFRFLEAGWSGSLLRTTIDDGLRVLAAVGGTPVWVLSNHDQVRHATRLGWPSAVGGARFLPLEARPPEVSDLDLGRRRARAATLLMLGLPGSAYLYQGEELGLEEVEDLPDELLEDPTWERSGHAVRGRDGCRVPIPWSGEAPPFGFGSSGSTPWLPQPAAWRERTVEAESRDPDSFLSLYRTALALRRSRVATEGDTIEWLDGPPSVLRFRRPGGLEVVVNLGAEPVSLGDRRVLVSSLALDADGRLPGDAAAWLG